MGGIFSPSPSEKIIDLKEITERKDETNLQWLDYEMMKHQHACRGCVWMDEDRNRNQEARVVFGDEANGLQFFIQNFNYFNNL